ncbi:HEPN domain-containing protein [Nitrosococcus oceani]|uniref:HEPN domain-containing protein n=1 Tax=Nitrosococcus oceani TaxID=1229 RepID=UPI0004E8759E|nr:HEPN domain-containing protein [Nitrosococcus oceani]KFI22269.1 hypothetical protein HW44_10505 [Nitrosococcus oceani]
MDFSFDESSLKTAIDAQMLELDAALAEANVSVPDRKRRAAFVFVNHCLSIEGSTKKDFWEKRWFAEIYCAIEDWYKEAYGAALVDERDQIKGFVVLNQTPILLEIPQTLSQPSGTKSRSWLIFAVEALDSEALSDWLPAGVDYSRLLRGKDGEAEASARSVVTRLRSLNNNLMTASFEDPALQRFRSSVRSHLEKAAEDCISNKPERLSIAMWEIHLAVEKTIKLFLTANNIDFPRTHELKGLRKLSNQVFDSGSLDQEFKGCPKAKDAINYRYCETDAPGVTDVDAYYRAALAIIDEYSYALPHEIRTRNARFELKMSPWLGNANA